MHATREVDIEMRAPGPDVAPHIRVIQGLSSQPRSPNQRSHFLTMVSKNLLMKKRAPMSTVLETILPVLFVCGLMAVWSGVHEGSVDEHQYVDRSGAPIGVRDFNAELAAVMCAHSTALSPIPEVRACTAQEESTPGALFCVAAVDAVLPGICVPGPNPMFLVNDWLNFEQPRFVPAFDELVVMQWIANITITGRARRMTQGSAVAGLINGGALHIAPDTPQVRAMIADFNTTVPLFKYALGNVFKTADEAIAYATANENRLGSWGVLEVAELSTSKLDVRLHLNRTGIPPTNQLTQVGNGIGGFRTVQYITAGFLTLQEMVVRHHAIKYLYATEVPRMVHIPMGFQAYDTSSFLTVIGSMAALFLVFGYLYPVSQLVKRIVEEKEQRMREAMMIMGLSTAPFYGSWIFTYCIFQLITAGLCAILLKATMLPKSDVFIIFLLFFLFGLSNITLSGAMSSFFSKSRIAALVAPVLFFIFAVPTFALPASTPAGTLIFLSLMSPTAFANGMKVLVDQEIAGGATWAGLNKSFNGYPISAVLLLLALDTGLYLLLTLYLDAVLPSEWGTRSGPCFCFSAFCKKKNCAAEGEGNDGRDPNGVYEEDLRDVSPSVQLRGVRKVFALPSGEKMTAVNDLTFNMYENQVFALLGHNGAGKTTAMNLMTGMLEMDGGDCRFHGHSVRHDLNRVRQEIGYCPQHNILWNELTCREHLRFFAKLKGLNAGVREHAVEAMLKAVDLEAKGDKYPHELSGGQKRKLSVGIAFVGGSKVVFLDEPTAGMDVAARRHTWELIKLMTPGRTIVLTTHFMDEADLLGNTVAIMAKGRLKCSGSSVFLKSRLGVGYTLTVSCAHGTDSNLELVETLRQYVPGLEVLSNGGGEVGVRLPMEAVPEFPRLLAHLEEQGPRMGIRGHGISVTTLEEIFLKIAHDDEDAAHAVNPGGARQTLWGGAEESGSLTDPDPDDVAVDVPRRDDKALIFTAEMAGVRSSPLAQFITLLVKRFHYSRRDTRTIVMQIVLPVTCITFGMLLTLIEFTDMPPLMFGDYSLYDGPSDIAFAACPEGWNSLLPIENTDAIGITTPGNFSSFLVENEKSHVDNRIGAHMCRPQGFEARTTIFANVSSTNLTASLFMTNNSIYLHAGPQALWEYHQTYLRSLSQTPFTFTLVTAPLPLSEAEKAVIDAIVTVFVAIFVLIPFTFIPSTFVSFVVKEREVHALQLQRASGLNYVVYWCANFVWDMMSFIITAVLAICIFAIFGRDEYVGDASTVIAILVLFLFYGIAGVAGSYICSFFFDSHSTAQNIVMLANFICGFVLVLLAYILSVVESAKDAGEALQFVFRLVPSYCLGEGILNMAKLALYEQFGSKQSVWDLKVIGYDLLYMGLEFPLFMAIVFFLDSPLRRAQQQAVLGGDGGDSVGALIADEDDDVAVERREIESGVRDSDHVVVKNLRKYYPSNGGVLAVKDLSFGVRRGEVFGFLGTNGAGKTTTMSILCGDQLPTKGYAWVAGYDVVKEAGQARKVIGYCPQFDALHDLLTPEEHMNLYAGLHGLTGALRTQVTERLMHVCGLDEHRKKESRSLSGGNKRKLSVAISLLGAPQVVFLDEPSAGMDPMARRHMWKVIEQVTAHCSVVLTTHHLEEVEALSSRMGIMVDGELKCIGPLQHLKTKFGSGFEMSLRVAEEGMVDAAEAFVQRAVEGSIVQERRGTKLTIALPPRTRLSTVFETIERHKTSLGVTDYSVSQTSLESVFLRISASAKNQSHE
jgi:ATP-binding cassette subfamily A (ABC1) protein 3